ncbi:MAG TPA: serine/threonine-protein kinase [Fimbriiglobus sp.]|jgi:serine/threonine-protein kinase
MTETTVSPDLDKFLKVFRTSQLVEEGHFDKVVAKLPPDTTDARRAAEVFVESGVITRFQADRLLTGRADGFHLGSYIILEPIGKGTISRVYKARHRTMNRFVAIKVLDPAKTVDTDNREAIQTEAKAAARLNHINVATVLDINRVNDRLYFVLEFVDGATAEATVKRSGPVPIGRACDLARQVALGLAHTHAKGVIHGAVNPSNLMIGKTTAKSDHVLAKLLNAGQARLRMLADAGPEGSVYAATDTELTPMGDLYGLGATLYFLLTGRSPVPYHKRGLSSDPLPVEHVRPDAPPLVLDLVRRLMSDDPTNRPSAADTAAWLEPFGEYLGGEAVDFNVPPTTASTLGSMKHTLLSGLVGTAVRIPEDSSWTAPNEQALVATLDAEVLATPVQTPSPRIPPAPVRVVLPAAGRVRNTPVRSAPTAESRSFFPYAVAGGIIVCILAIVGVVLRFAMK